MAPTYQPGSAELASALKEADLLHALVVEAIDAPMTLANLIAAGHIVCTFDRESDLGQGALGARYILSDPRREQLTRPPNSVTEYEKFTSFAAVTWESHLADYFEKTTPGPYMSLAFPTQPSRAAEISAAVSTDGTVWVKAFRDNERSNTAAVLREFTALTGTPVLLNASSDPTQRRVTESVTQAAQIFSRLPIAAMLIGRFVIVRPEHWRAALSADARSLISLTLPPAGSAGAATTTSDDDVLAVMRRIAEITQCVVFVRRELPLYTPYLRQLLLGLKRTTIRFRRGGVEIPATTTMELLETPDFTLRSGSHIVGKVNVRSVRHARFGDLTEADATNDGFDSVDRLRAALLEIYSCMGDDDWVTIYELEVKR
jgi:hypothetical protein